MSDNLYGLLAEFQTPEALVNAARTATKHGYTRMDAYTPFPIEELSDAFKHRHSRLPLIFLLGGILGGAGGYFMEWYSMAVDYPINVGSRPLHSWPSFVPVTFELTILFAALCGVLGLFLLMKLPRPHHPLFGIEDFQRASDDRFFLCLEKSDPKFSPESARQFLQTLAPERITEVPE